MSSFNMKYNDAVNICESTYDKIWSTSEKYYEQAVDGFEHFKYEMQRAYNYVDDITGAAFRYGVGIVENTLSNGSLLVDNTLDSITDYVYRHFDLDLPEGDLTTFKENIGNLIYKYFTDEDSAPGLDAVIKLPVTAVDGALNINIPIALYDSLKRYSDEHYNVVPSGDVTWAGQTYHNVAGYLYYNRKSIPISFNKRDDLVKEKVGMALAACGYISSELTAYLLTLLNAQNIADDYMSDFADDIQETIVLQRSTINSQNAIRVFLYPKQIDTRLYGPSVTTLGSNNYVTLRVGTDSTEYPSDYHYYLPFKMEFVKARDTGAVTDWELVLHNYESYGGAMPPLTTGGIVEYSQTNWLFTNFEPAVIIPEPVPYLGSIASIGEMPVEPIAQKSAPEPEPEPGSNPAPLPEPPELGGDIPYAPSETDVQTGMAAIYNPTYAQVRELADFLWTSDFVDQVKKLFQSPIDTIISLHKVYVTPKTAGTDNIYCGFIQTDVANVKKVSNRYTYLDCGRVYIPEYYGSARDYIYSDLKVYLPFCGIMSLNISEFLGAYMHVYYNVDVLTGSCAAFVSKIVGHSEKILYTFSGNCSMQIPLSSGSYLGGFQSLLSAGASLLSGNVMGAVSGVASAATHTLEVQRSGNLTSNVGVMSPKRPYVLISRKYPNEYQRDRGLDVYRLNKPVENIQSFLAGCTAGDKVVINDFIPTARAGENPTAAELDALTAMLSQGIII